MYEYFHGKLAHKYPLHVVVDVHGIGYKLLTPINLLEKLPQVGEMVFLYVSWVVREMSQTLYAFATQEERDLFEILLTLSGIGPKTALAIVGHFELSELEETVRKGNSTVLTHVPGVGKKTAERLLVDLKGKLKLTSFPKAAARSSKVQDALNALLHLGCSQTQAEHAVQKAVEELSDECDLSALITSALKYQKASRL